MKITILTLFPEMFHDFLNTSIIARALQKNLAEVEVVDIRDYATGSYRHVDDSPLGGGAGMILKCQPVLDCLDAVSTPNSHKVLFTPTGNTWSQQKAHDFAKMDHIVLLCGHYEGIDARVYDHVDELLSIGDYVLTGGELPAMIICDSVIRLLKGSIKEESAGDESYENGLLEYPQYTQPADYKGEKVPEVLISGHHENIRRWRLKESLRITEERRPDLLQNRQWTKEEQILMAQLQAEKTVASRMAQLTGNFTELGGILNKDGRSIKVDALWFTDHLDKASCAVFDKPNRILTDDFSDDLNSPAKRLLKDDLLTDYFREICYAAPLTVVSIQDETIRLKAMVGTLLLLGVPQKTILQKYETMSKTVKSIFTEIEQSGLSSEGYYDEHFGVNAKDRRKLRQIFLEGSYGNGL